MRGAPSLHLRAVLGALGIEGDVVEQITDVLEIEAEIDDSFVDVHLVLPSVELLA